MSRQVAVPVSDIADTPGTFPQEWVRGDTGLTSPDLWSKIDDVLFDPTAGDYIVVPSQLTTNQSTSYVAKLSTLQTPFDTSSVTVIYYAAYNAIGNQDTNLNVEVYEGDPTAGGVQRAIWSETHATGLVNGTATRFHRGFNGSAITNWANLYLKVTAFCTVFNTGFDGMVLYNFNMIVTAAGSAGPKAILQFPQSPVHGWIKAQPSTNGGPLWQLINGNTTKSLFVHELYVWGVGDGSHHAGLNREAAFGVRRTDAPFDVGVGGTITNGTMRRLDARDTTAIGGQIRGINFVNSQFYDGVGNAEYHFYDIDDMGDAFGEANPDGIKNIFSQWLQQPDASTTRQPTGRIIVPGMFPWVVAPQSAIEILWLDNGVNFTLAEAVWDERNIV